MVKYVKINNKVKNQREDFLHKTSTKLANEYDYIFIENINLSNICKYKNLGKATNDNAYRKFVKMLNYKMEDRGKLLVEIDKYYPSTRKCHCCGYVRERLSLDQREWVCPKCGITHNRDINAAINIKNRGIEIVSKKAAGQSVCNRA